MGWIKRAADKLRKYLLRKGYTCDFCGDELFDYPAHRLCAACEEKLQKPALPCPLCGRERRAEGLCMDCKAAPPLFHRGVSPFVYRGESALLVNRVKGGNPKLAAYVGEQMANALLAVEECRKALMNSEGEGLPLLILPVPATAEKRKRRGFNQAERLAESVYDTLLSHGVKGSFAPRLLIKTRETQPQKRMTRQERAENVRGAYRVENRATCKGRRVLLVDDVTTTCSTGNEIAKKLLQAGATEVYFLTAAAAPERE